MKVYKFDVSDTDLSLTNFTIVSKGDSYYIPDNYTISIVGKNKKISDIIFQVKNKDVLITDSAFQFPNDTKVSAPIDIFDDKSKIDDNTVLVIKFKYNLNNVSKEAYQSIPLKSHKKTLN